MCNSVSGSVRTYCPFWGLWVWMKRMAASCMCFRRLCVVSLVYVSWRVCFCRWERADWRSWTRGSKILKIGWSMSRFSLLRCSVLHFLGLQVC